MLLFDQRQAPPRSPYQLLPPMILILLGMVLVVGGIFQGDILLIRFPSLAFFPAKRQLSYWLIVPKQKMHWWYARMDGMFTASIATVTAFLVTALPRIWPNPFTNSSALWFAPGVILGFILSKWTQL